MTDDRKNIKVYPDTYEKLEARKERGESFDRVINDLLENDDGVDYAEIENRVERAIDRSLPERQ